MQRNARPVQGIGDSWVRSLSPPPSSLPELRKLSSIRNRPFLRGFLSPIFKFPVSADINGLSGGFLASRLCIQKFRSRRPNFGTKRPAGARESPADAEKRASSSFGTYCGFNPRVSNCRLHSAGASRSRATPMPRGKRPSTAALTRAGARNASEMVILTCRTLHFWRLAAASEAGRSSPRGRHLMHP
jgi:hypothetical protein